MNLEQSIVSGDYLDLLSVADQGRMVAMLWRGGRPNPFCECVIVGLLTTFYIVMCDTPHMRGELTVLG